MDSCTTQCGLHTLCSHVPGTVPGERFDPPDLFERFDSFPWSADLLDYSSSVAMTNNSWNAPLDDNRALEITGCCESIETTLRTIRFLWAGTLIRMSDGRLPERVVFGNLEGAVRRGRGGKEKEWTDYVQSDIRAFGIAGDWKVTALKG